MKNKLTTIIWDWNGTLLNDLDICVNLINSLLKERNLKTINSTIYQSIFSFPVIHFYEKLGFDFTRENYQVLADDFILEYNKALPSCHLHHNAKTTLKHFFNLGITQNILSVMQEDSLIKAVNSYGINNFFKHVLGTKNNLAQNKFKRSEELLKLLKTDPENICFIGDTLHDLEVAEHIGTKCIILSHGHHSLERLQEKNVLVVSNLSEIKNGLSQLFTL